MVFSKLFRKNYMEFKYGIEIDIKEDDKRISQDKKN